MTLPGVKEATDALCEQFGNTGLSRRAARSIALKMLKAAYPIWEQPIRELHDPKREAGRIVCSECFHDAPCPTRKVLNDYREPPKRKPKQSKWEPAVGYAAWGFALTTEALPSE